MAPISTPPKSSNYAASVVNSVVIALAIISVALRFYTRKISGSGLGADDWLILVAAVATLASAVILLWENFRNPNGVWVSENDTREYVYTAEDVFYLQLLYAFSIIYFNIAGATKLAILLMYYRIFSISTSFRYQLLSSFALAIVWWIGCTIATSVKCIPLEWSWNNSLTDPRHCFNYNIFWMVSGTYETFLDTVILILPISFVVRMHLSAKRKVTVSIIFLLGVITIVTGLIKVVLSYPPDSRLPSYSNTEVWTTVHASLAIVCASLPIFGPLVRRISQISKFTKASNQLFTPQYSPGQSITICPEAVPESSFYQKTSTGGLP